MTNFKISCSLDLRRADRNGLYPMRLCVYANDTQKRKRYPTIFKFKKLEEFEHIYRDNNLRGNNQKLQTQIEALEAAAKKVAEDIPHFNFEDFERLMFNKTTTDRNVNYFYAKTIDKFKQKESISTAKNYETSLKCLLRFHKKPILNFSDVTVSWLEQFEKHCTEKEGKTKTTVSIYLRTLRTIYNDAIADNAAKKEMYPFGKRKYQVPSTKKVKKALDPTQLKALFEGTPQTPEQTKAKAFWFFSYLCNGMNFKDILNLKFEDITDTKITFIRAKTAKTNANASPITVYLNEYTQQVINEYGNKQGKSTDFVFPEVTHHQTAEEKYRAVKNFIRMVNQNFLKYAQNNGITEPVSSYWARHSFATMAIRKGMSIEFVGEAVGHTNTKTTMGYFAGFEDQTKKDFSNQLLDF